MLIEKPPKLIRRFFPNFIWKIETDEPVLFLTFDDGPIPEATPLVIRILEKYNAKATFFCVGDNVRKHPAVYEHIRQSGHLCGNHTFNHLQGHKTPFDVYINNIELAAVYIESNLFRPPHGILRRRQTLYIHNTLKYNIVMWDVLSRDYNQTISKEQCFLNVAQNADKGSIVVFHDSLKALKNMEYALEKTLDHFSHKGFLFHSLETILNNK